MPEIMSGDARWGRRQTLGRASFLVAAVLACTLVVAAPTAASGKRDDLSGIYGLPQGAAVPRAGASCTRNIVVAMSSVGYVPLQNGQNHTVGYYLDELTIPLMALQGPFALARAAGRPPRTLRRREPVAAAAAPLALLQPLDPDFTKAPRRTPPWRSKLVGNNEPSVMTGAY